MDYKRRKDFSLYDKTFAGSGSEGYGHGYGGHGNYCALFCRSEMAIWKTDKKYGNYLSQVAYHILRSLCGTEEIINDTYMGAWKAIPPTRPDNLKYFLSRITRNLSFDRLDYLNAGKRNALLVEMSECIPDRKNDMEEIGFGALQDIVLFISLR